MSRQSGSKKQMNAQKAETEDDTMEDVKETATPVKETKQTTTPPADFSPYQTALSLFVSLSSLSSDVQDRSKNTLRALVLDHLQYSIEIHNSQVNSKQQEVAAKVISNSVQVVSLHPQKVVSRCFEYV